MADAQTFTPYSTVSGFFGAAPGWIPTEELERIQSYQVYEEMYWNHPTSFRLMLRGAEARPIYIPSGKTIVNAICRYTAKKMALQFPGDDTVGTARAAFESLFQRERFNSKFASGKRIGAIRGDWLLHVTADDLKAPGTRLSIHLVDPASYFPVYDDETGTRIVKVHLAETFLDEKGNTRVRRQTYTKTAEGVTTELSIFEMDKWYGENEGAAIQVVTPPRLLPSQVTAIPVYHFRNSVVDDLQPYGNSEMKGIERVMAGINQGMTDEDIALALEGLGLYKTGNGAPVDDDGNDTDWVIGPGRVMEDETFERVNGIGSVNPYQDHVKMLDTFMKESAGVPAIAVGKVADVQVAESGIALALEMAPILARAEDNEVELVDVLGQMFYDLKAWFAAYEGFNFEAVAIVISFGNPLPTNAKAEVDLVTKMMSTVPPLMSATTGREYLTRKLGYEFPEDEMTRISQEASATAASSQAALGESATATTSISDRVRQEMAATTDTATA